METWIWGLIAYLSFSALLLVLVLWYAPSLLRETEEEAYEAASFGSGAVAPESRGHRPVLTAAVLLCLLLGGLIALALVALMLVAWLERLIAAPPQGETRNAGR